MISWQAKALNFFLKYSVKPAQPLLTFSPFVMKMVRFSAELAISRIPTPSFVDVDMTEIEGIPCDWVSVAESDDERVLLYLHGGGFFFGSPRTHRPMLWRLAKQTGMKVLAPEYRKLPEYELPAPMEDAVACYKWLLKQGYKPENIAIGGDSAGGNLTLVTLLALRDEGIEMPKAAFVLSPFADLSSTSDSLIHNARAEVMFHHRAVRKVHKILTRNVDPFDPKVSPVYGDFSGLPPLFIHTSTTEVLLDDSHRVVYQAQKAGIDVTHSIWHNVPHVFTVFVEIIPEAKKGVKEISKFVLEHVPRLPTANADTVDQPNNVEKLK